MANAAATPLLVLLFVLSNFWFIYLGFVPSRDFEAELAAVTSRIEAVHDRNSPPSLSEEFRNKEEESNAPAPSPGNSVTKDVEFGRSTENGDKRENSGTCEFSKGQWVPDTTPPIYTNETCRFIQPNQNCVKNGRPDLRYLNWRWQPEHCDLAVLDPRRFLELVKGKKMIFIGDSMARNHMQSLLCALAQVEEPHKLEKPEVIFFESDKEMRWGFDRHNFTLTHIWSPFLVNFSVGDDPSDRYHVHLDTPDEIWTSKVVDYDIAVVSTGYWYYRPSTYHAKGGGVLDLGQLPAYRRAYQTVLGYLATHYRGVTMVRTATVDHFEFGAWYTGGVCNRTLPFSPEDASVRLPYMSSTMNRIQIEEVENAKAIARESAANASWRVGILDVTYSAFMRPDGHPNFFKVQEPGQPPRNDCLHWCLPGPVDMWNQLIFHLVKQFF